MTSPQEGATPGISALDNLLAHPPGLPVAKQLSEVVSIVGRCCSDSGAFGTGKTTSIPAAESPSSAGELPEFLRTTPRGTVGEVPPVQATTDVPRETLRGARSRCWITSRKLVDRA